MASQKGTEGFKITENELALLRRCGRTLFQFTVLDGESVERMIGLGGRWPVTLNGSENGSVSS